MENSSENSIESFTSGFNEDIAGKRAECEGGGNIKGTKYSGRQRFVGRLTGHYRDFGTYPWRWYLLTELTVKPQGYANEAVWCDEESIELLEG